MAVKIGIAIDRAELAQSLTYHCSKLGLTPYDADPTCVTLAKSLKPARNGMFTPAVNDNAELCSMIKGLLMTH